MPYEQMIRETNNEEGKNMKGYDTYLIVNEDTKKIVKVFLGTKEEAWELYDKMNEERPSNDWDTWSIFERVIRK